MKPRVKKDWSFLIGRYYPGIKSSRPWLILDITKRNNRTHLIEVLAPNGTVELARVDDTWLDEIKKHLV